MTTLGAPGGLGVGARNWIFVLSSVAALGTIALVIFLLDDGTSAQKQETATAPVTDGQSREAATPNRPPTSASPRTMPVKRVRQKTARSAGGSTGDESFAISQRAWPEPSPLARQLVQTLAGVDPRPEKMTPEIKLAWQRQLAEFQNQGTVAVAAIAEFFKQHPDVGVDAGQDGDVFQQQAVRIALLKMLLDLPAPDNLDLQEQLLRTTVNPEEIAVLAGQLELLAPGEYQDTIVKAAKASLQYVRSGNLPWHDPGPMVRLLRLNGESEE
jgi:hypothetical protein